jgi:uncharacterized protein YebE (UPF0316 family)
MILRLLFIFIAGVIETWIYTGWAITANQNRVIASSVLMFLYMLTYLFILDAAFKDANSKWMILVYALSCGVGNLIRVYQESKKVKNEKNKKLQKIS